MSEAVFYPMRRRLKGSFILLPGFLERIKRFEAEGSDQWCQNLAARFEGSFCKDDDMMLGVAFMDGHEMCGHAILGIESMLGTPAIVVYQYAKDQGWEHDPEDTHRQLEALVRGWAASLSSSKGLTLKWITFLCKGEARARLFGMLGYQRGPVLMRKEVGNG